MQTLLLWSVYTRNRKFSDLSVLGHLSYACIFVHRMNLMLLLCIKIFFLFIEVVPGVAEPAMWRKRDN
jgi:hypothetical protein